MSFRPAIVDWNGDGRLDILSGSTAGLVFVLLQGPSKTFSAAEVLSDRCGEILNVGGNSFCWAADWDGDNDQDFFIGCRMQTEERPGSVFIVENAGDRRKHSMMKPVPIKAGRSADRVRDT